MKRAVLACACVWVAGAAMADRYVVESGSAPDGVYSNWGTAANSIQAAVNVAGVGETVWVSNGTYTLTAEISVTKGVVIQGFNGRSVTFVNGNYPAYSIRCFNVNHADAVIRGLTITNGHPLSAAGAGVYLTKGTLDDCAILLNAVTSGGGYQGGGLNVAGGPALVTNCVFADNSCTGYGAGVYVAANAGARVVDCLVSNNTGASYGAGVYLANSNELAGCVVVDNVGPETSSGLGGGAYCSGVFTTVKDCRFVRNRAYDGGGLYASDATVLRCAAISNTAQNGGGFSLNNAASLSDCDALFNAAKYGGGCRMALTAVARNCSFNYNTWTGTSCNAAGVYMSGAAKLFDCDVIGNTNTDSRGGGAYVTSSTGVTISNSVFSRNLSADYGAGICLANGSGIVIDRCVISSNETYKQGGGVYYVASQVLIRNTLLYTNRSNTGGGIHVQSGSPIFESCTIAGNVCTGNYAGGVMSWSGTALFTNCIVYGNVCTWAGQAAKNNWSNLATNMSYSCTTPLTGITGPGNTNSDPLYVDIVAGNLRLGATSPCKDAGSSQGWMTGAIDLAGKARVTGTSVDMGAYEYVPDEPKRGILMILL